MSLFYLGVFVVAVLLSFLLTKFVRDLATARGWVSMPGHGRHLHLNPLPRFGGVAIFSAFLVAIGGAACLAAWYPALDFGFSWKTFASIVLPGAVIFLMGIYDDLHGLGPAIKFAVQAAAGGMLFLFGMRVLDLPVLFGGRHFPWYISLPLTILWVIAITNAFNLIDGLDGLAAGSALFSTLVVFVVALLSHSTLVSFMALALTGAILGFLRFNFNPATIFLGDSGSLFIGFMLSALALRGTQKAPTIIAVAIPVVSFGLPILETTLSVLRRFISGRPVFTADREHIHHKLLELGMSHRQVVVLLYGVSAVFAMLSLFLLWPTGSTLGLVLAVVGAGIWVGVQHLGYLEFGELRRVAQRTIEQRQIFINNLAVRRALEELRVTRSCDQLCRVLVAAFGGNDFDAFELALTARLVEPPQLSAVRLRHSHSGGSSLLWKKPNTEFSEDSSRVWSLHLDLVGAGGRHWGALTVFRLYSQPDLRLDINLLTGEFPLALAEAVERILGQPVEILSSAEREFRPAQAG